MQDNKKISPFINFELEEGEELRLVTPIKGISDNVKENTYGITSKGRVFSTARSSDSTTTAKELSLNYSMDGYTRVWLSSNTLNESKEYIVSRLVLTYFGGPIPDDPSKYDANHKDYKRDNNNIENLEWLTHEENIKYSYVNTDHVTDEQVLDIYNRVVVNNEDPEIVAKDYNRSRRTIMDAAHGIGNFEKIHKRLGLEYFKIHKLEDKEIIDIYKDLLDHIDPKELSEKYHVSEAIIKKIRRKSIEYRDPIKDFPDIDTSILKNKFNKEEALLVYKTIVSGRFTQNELCKMFNTTSLTIHDIKFCENGYEFLKTEYGIEPPMKQLNRFDDETALKIYYMAKNGKTSKEISKELGVCVPAVDNIKFCRGQYKFLIDDYGLEPVESRARKFKNRVAINPKL